MSDVNTIMRGLWELATPKQLWVITGQVGLSPSWLVTSCLSHHLGSGPNHGEGTSKSAGVVLRSLSDAAGSKSVGVVLLSFSNDAGHWAARMAKLVRFRASPRLSPLAVQVANSYRQGS